VTDAVEKNDVIEEASAHDARESVQAERAKTRSERAAARREHAASHAKRTAHAEDAGTADKGAKTKHAKRTKLGLRDELDAVRSDAKERANGTARSLIPKGRRLAVILAAVVLALVFVYGPLRNLYVAKRDALRLQAQYEALSETNEGIEGDIGALQSREGIEDEARRRGYVEEGEVSINVEGLDVEDDSATTSQVDSTYGANAYEAPWYIEVLDVIFLYDGGQ
jgi:cell division protein FtsB